jgi:hypothetical protein
MSAESRGIIEEFAGNPLLGDASEDELILLDSPYRRPTRIFDNRFIDFDRPLAKEDLASNSSLSTHRLLLNVYESDMLFLPKDASPAALASMRKFYSYEHTLHAEKARSILERKAFAFLDEDVEIIGAWSGEMVVQYFRKYLDAEQSAADQGIEADPLLSKIVHARAPGPLARHYLIQQAADFLTEASAMARYITGSYGNLQSTLFNILIDEYGAGVHARKHSTLFEDTLESLGMQTEVHAYWQFYHASSLALVNYFHYVTRNKALFFRYLGALFFTEVTLINTAKRQSAMLRSVFGKAVDRTYFDEHHHIDQHHGDMALNRLVAPALERFGDEVAAEVLLGFEQFRLLQREADLDLLAQFEWADELDRFRDRAAELYPKIESGEIDAPLETFVEARGERSTTHVHPNDRLLVIERGSMDFWPLYGEPLRLDEGALMYIPRHRLHGSVVRSAECVYHQPIVGDLHPTAAVA